MITVSMPQEEYQKNLDEATKAGVLAGQRSLAECVIAIFRGDEVALTQNASEPVREAINLVRDIVGTRRYHSGI